MPSRIPGDHPLPDSTSRSNGAPVSRHGKRPESLFNVVRSWSAIDTLVERTGRLPAISPDCAVGFRMLRSRCQSDMPSMFTITRPRTPPTKILAASSVMSS